MSGGSCDIDGSLLALLVSVGWAVGSCGGGAENSVGICTAVQTFAIEVSVRDSVTGRAIADSARGTFVVGGVTDTLARADSLVLLGGHQLGSYTVIVTRPGYDGWSASDVMVTEHTPCGGVVGVELTARLQPAVR